jgi:hypothetical protein
MVPVALPLTRAVAASKGDPTTNNFAERVCKLLDRIDCRHADTPQDREAIFRLRYEAYLREGTIYPNAARSFSDPHDETDNAYLFGLHIDGQLASSLRIHVGSAERPYFPSFEIFSDVLRPKLDAGNVIIDATRFVTDEALSKRYRALPYATVRLNWLAAGYFKNGYSLAAVRLEHAAFYQRTFGLKLICGPRSYPYLVKPICLMASDYKTVAAYVHWRYPFFRSTFFERKMLFERSGRQQTSVQSNLATLARLDAPQLAG